METRRAKIKWQAQWRRNRKHIANNEANFNVIRNSARLRRVLAFFLFVSITLCSAKNDACQLQLFLLNMKGDQCTRHQNF